jgi:uncharacterized membrane protein YhiD involved in acid resistance
VRDLKELLVDVIGSVMLLALIIGGCVVYERQVRKRER